MMFDCRLQDIINNTLKDQVIKPEYIEEIAISLHDSSEDLEELDDLLKDLF